MLSAQRSALSGATAIIGVLLALRIFRIDHIFLYGLPDFGLPNFVLIDLLGRLLTLLLLLRVRIFLVLSGHRDSPFHYPYG